MLDIEHNSALAKRLAFSDKLLRATSLSTNGGRSFLTDFSATAAFPAHKKEIQLTLFKDNIEK